MSRAERFRRSHCTVPGHGTRCSVAHEITASAKAAAKKDRRQRGVRLSRAYLLGFAVVTMTTNGCATFSQAQRDAAALVMALDSYLEACEAQQEPKPRGCAEAERLRVQLEPYVQVVQP